MTEPVPPDGVSAFYDEELSPSELKEMAHHLSHSLAAQSELADIRRLSEELRNLPQDSAPRTLLSGVMREVHAKAVPGPGGWHESRNARRALGKFIVAALVLAVCVAVIPSLWKGPEPTQEETTAAVLDTGGEAPKAIDDLIAESIAPPEPGAEKPRATHLGSEGELLVQKNSTRALANATSLPAEGAADPKLESNRQLPAAPPMPFGVADAGLPQVNKESDKIKLADPELKKSIESAIANEHVLIVELTVNDTQSALERFQAHLAQNEVAPANFALQGLLTEEKQKGVEADSQIALFVQSTPEQVTGALQGLEQDQPGSQMNPLSSLALNEVLLRDGEDDELAGKDQSIDEAARSLAQVLALYESGQAGQGGGGKVAAGAAMRFRADPNADDKLPRAAKTEAGLENAPSVASADFGALNAPGNPADRKSGQGRWKSFQFLLNAPKDAWQQATEDQAEAAIEKKPAVALQNRRANAVANRATEPAKGGEAAELPADSEKEESAPKPIRTLFIFRSATQAK